MTAAARGRCLQFKAPADHSIWSHFGVLRQGFDSTKARMPEVRERRRTRGGWTALHIDRSVRQSFWNHGGLRLETI